MPWLHHGRFWFHKSGVDPSHVEFDKASQDIWVYMVGWKLLLQSKDSKYLADTYPTIFL